jgi:hypothetical protein
MSAWSTHDEFDESDTRYVLQHAAGLHPAHDCVFKIIHVRYEHNCAWHPAFKWTQLHRGWVFTYDDACRIEDLSPQLYKAAFPEDGRWYAWGTRIPLNDYRRR